MFHNFTCHKAYRSENPLAVLIKIHYNFVIIWKPKFENHGPWKFNLLKSHDGPLFFSIIIVYLREDICVCLFLWNFFIGPEKDSNVLFFY